ncbi:hypothetical protein DIPPA_06934 [Diplonema papillatum]|nr:hypothetical protein DIPPA_06934 [Diplonema papillatum]
MILLRLVDHDFFDWFEDEAGRGSRCGGRAQDPLDASEHDRDNIRSSPYGVGYIGASCCGSEAGVLGHGD